MSEGVVIIGAGHCGVQTAASLRDEGYDGRIVLVSHDKHLPYQRPPLSKAFLKGDAAEESLMLRAPSFYKDKNIDLLLGERVAELDRRGKRALLENGSSLSYDHLILTVGSVSRPASFSGSELNGVFSLRSIDDAIAVKDWLKKSENVVIIGAGFIGLEFAATAAAQGKNTRVVEVAPRVMGRAVSPGISDFFLAAHRAFKVKMHLDVKVAAIEGVEGKAEAVLLEDGRRLPADLVLLGIGVLADESLASACGLAVGNGVEVDDFLTTSDPTISAAGDCAAHINKYAGKRIRLESIQNAVDQAKTIAKKLVGKPMAYDALPWFWSDQGDLKLQIAGWGSAADAFVLRGDPEQRSFSVFSFQGGQLKAVESINRPADHMIARRLISSKLPLTLDQAGDPSFDLKAYAATPPTARS